MRFLENTLVIINLSHEIDSLKKFPKDMQFSSLKCFLGVSYFRENWSKIDENDLKSAEMHEKWNKGFLRI